MAIVYRDHRSCDVIHPVYSHSRGPGRDRGLLGNLALTTRLEYFCVSRLSNGTPSSAAETMQSVFSFDHRPSTRHCPHLLLSAGACHRSIHRVRVT